MPQMAVRNGTITRQGVRSLLMVALMSLGFSHHLRLYLVILLYNCQLYQNKICI